MDEGNGNGGKCVHSSIKTRLKKNPDELLLNNFKTLKS